MARRRRRPFREEIAREVERRVTRRHAEEEALMDGTATVVQAEEVCGVCGVAVGRSMGSGRLVHLDGIPSGVDPEHDVIVTTATAFRDSQVASLDLRLAASDMLVHHATTHPVADCEWAHRLSDALRSRA